MDGWRKIWEEREGLSKEFLRENENKEFCIYAKLKKLDGFDISVENENGYNCFLKEFESMLETMSRLVTDKGTIHSVYEVGCGSGANLFLFNNRIEGFIGGGIDYSKKQIDTIRTVFPQMKDFTCGEAIELETNLKYDVVMSESVFQYFPSEEYARSVVEKMIDKAYKLVYIGEICDVGRKLKTMMNYIKIWEDSFIPKCFLKKLRQNTVKAFCSLNVKMKNI